MPSSLDYNFVKELLNISLQLPSADSKTVSTAAYASEVVQYLLEKRVVSSAMISTQSGLLGALRARDDWVRKYTVIFINGKTDLTPNFHHPENYRERIQQGPRSDGVRNYRISARCGCPSSCVSVRDPCRRQRHGRRPSSFFYDSVKRGCYFSAGHAEPPRDLSHVSRFFAGRSPTIYSGCCRYHGDFASAERMDRTAS